MWLAMENFVNTTDKSYTALNNELFELCWPSNTDCIWKHNQSTQAYMHFSEFVFYFACCESARWKSYRTEAHQHRRNLEEWLLALANLVHPLQVTSQKAGAATWLQSPLPIVMMKLFLLWRSLWFKRFSGNRWLLGQDRISTVKTERNRVFQRVLGLLRYLLCR